MTDKNPDYWDQPSGVYLQPPVCNPPMNQNPNNARHAIWHLGRPIITEFYPSANHTWGANEDGRHDRGEPTLVTVYGTIQPLSSEGATANAARGLQRPAEAERNEGRMIVHVDSMQPENLEAALAFPSLFPDGQLRILGPDDPAYAQNFVPVFRYARRRYKVINVMEQFEGGDEEVAPDGAIYRCTCGLFEDVQHERQAGAAEAAQHDPSGWGPDT